MSITTSNISFSVLATILLSCCTTSKGERTLPPKIVVCINGKGSFKSIQAAINSLPDSSATPRTIFIRQGLYSEKIFITKHNIILEGENEDKIITQDIARDKWRCDHPDDWRVATININGNDITLANLTVENAYGSHVRANRTVDCASDSINHQKVIHNDGHQMALRTMLSTRLKAIHCRFIAYGGDTVSPWNVENGIFYFKKVRHAGWRRFLLPPGMGVGRGLPLFCAQWSGKYLA